MAKRKRTTKLKKFMKKAKQYSTWVLIFLAGFMACLLLFWAVKALTDADFVNEFDKTLDDILNETDKGIETLETWLYGEDPGGITVEPPTPEGSLRVDIIDVGQGESILITTAEKAVLIDAGENDQGDEVLAHLQERGIESLDLAIGTHAHSDHIGGMDTVLKEMPTTEFWMGSMPDRMVPSTKTYLDVLEQLDIGRIPYREPEVGTQYDLGNGGILTVLGPQGKPDDLNNCSLVCRVDFGEIAFLFSGDAEKAEEEAILASGADLDVDVMTMGHHGSETSSHNAYFKAASPDYAAISVGNGNSYGHPHSSTIKKLKNGDVIYRRTDINGTITFITNGNIVEYSSEK